MAMTVNQLIEKLLDLPDGDAEILFHVDGVAWDLCSVKDEKRWVQNGEVYKTLGECQKYGGKLGYSEPGLVYLIMG